ncbi:FKBP-type peptidyl-prolyl cis-trans isomerase SlyD [Solimonas aquatica]|uniref:Peptidyl-prolyl cis-trans isomerase n=2 Tax=Solimonas aquatica TaxID=489703 RepID=A0A1H9L074_9GAMM|nr:FKBP-type peptidyl-prolyl cis-trans isomerase SlyD [Solimonas aquatica]
MRALCGPSYFKMDIQMEIADQRVVVMHYTLTNTQGEVLDSSRGGEPLTYLHGAGNIIPGLEKALVGKQAGDSLNVQVQPAEGYGERREELVQQVPKRAFQGVKDVQPGMSFQAQGQHGPMRVVVTKVLGDMVTIDGNHPLAGEVLNFDVEITEVRAATAEEMQHGHVHGPGGHHH